MSTTAIGKSSSAARLKLFDRIVRDIDITGMSVKVAWRLISHINNRTGLCYPGIERLANDLGANERTVRRAIDLLIRRGWFTKRRRGYRGFQYFPNYGRPAETLVDEDEGALTEAPDEPDKHDQNTRAEMSAEHSIKQFTKPSDEQESVCKITRVSDPTPHADPTANSTWNSHRAELIEAIGEGDFSIWLDPLTPESDDNRIFVLAAMNQFSVDRVILHFRDDLERVLGRKVVVVERSWAAEAYRRRLAERVAASKTNKVADNETHQ